MGHLTRANKKLRWVTLTQVAILMVNVLEASKRADVGFEHADVLLNDFMRALEKYTKLSNEDLQSALWSANLMNEKGLWWHPDEMPFKDFLKRLLPDAKFDHEYNLIIQNESGGKK